jgi:hypothetical protein
MTIGPDIEEALDEVGTAVTIIDSAGVSHTGEYIYYKPNSQATKPFIREFFLEAWLPYNTAATSGDLIRFNVTGTYYMLMNLTPFMFENSIIRRDGVLYKCNVTAVLLRPTEVRGSNYLTRTVWEVIEPTLRCLITTPLYGNELETDEAIGHLGLEVHELYAQDLHGIRVNDRIKVSSDQYYRVESIKYRRYDGVTTYELGEDTRAYTTTTTTTTTTSTSTTTTTTA